MSSHISGSQNLTRDLFGGVLKPDADIFKNDSPKNSRFQQLKTDFADRSSDEISLNSLNRRTSLHKQHSDPRIDSKNPSLVSINQNANSSNSSNAPLWFNNPKRRTIPSHVVKRESDNGNDSSTFSTKSKSSTDGSSSDFRTLTFGTRRNISEMAHVNALSDELPPTRTISDLQKEENSDSYLSFHLDNSINNVNSFTGSNIDSDSPSKVLPDHLFKSQEQQGSAFSTPSKANDSLLMKPLQQVQQSIPEQSQKSQQLHHISQESAVLVFGYPESIANNVIKHFAKFGTILEGFESTRMDPVFHSKKPKKIYPIYTGDGWVKLTYDSKASAIRALEESGSVFFGSIIGCVPYSKEAVEKIASISINESQDIGESEFLSHSPLENGGASSNNENAEDLLKFNPNKKSTRLSLKNDDKIFIKSQDLKKTLYAKKISENSNAVKNNSIFTKVNNWLFGWEDL